MKNRYLKTLIVIIISINTFAQNVPSYVPTNGLVGWWPFNGNGNDESGNGHSMSDNPTMSQPLNQSVFITDRMGNTNSAVRLTIPYNPMSSTQKFTFKLYPNLPIIEFPKSHSISLWFNSTDKDGSFLYTMHGDATIHTFPWQSDSYPDIDVSWIALTELGEITFETLSLGKKTNNNYNYNDGKWHHIVAVYLITNSDQIIVPDYFIIYIDNEIVPQIEINPNNNGKNAPYQFKGGINFGGGVRIDDIAIYNRPLSQVEVSSLNKISESNYLYKNEISDLSIKIHPNPSSGIITIKNENFSTLNKYSIKIVDVLGKEYYNQPFNSSEMKIVLNDLVVKGTYILHILDSNNLSIKHKQIILE